jgi:hypothetical protein
MAKKFDFLSPGIEIREIDQSFIPQEREAEGPIIIGRTRKGPANKPVRVRNLDDFVSVFGLPVPGGVGQGDVWRDGNTAGTTYASYAAQAWLASENSPVTVVRLAGEASPDVAGETGKAGWQIGNDGIGTTGDNSTAYGLFLCDDTDAAQASSLDITLDGGVTANTDLDSVNVEIKVAGSAVATVTFDSNNSTVTVALTTITVGTSAMTTTAEFLGALATGIERAITEGFLSDASVHLESATLKLFNFSATGGNTLQLLSDTSSKFNGGSDLANDVAGNIIAIATSALSNGALAAVIYCVTGALGLVGDQIGAAASDYAGTLLKSKTASSGFELKVYAADGTTTSTIPFNFDRASENYIRNVLNTNPQLTNAATISSTKTYWLGETYKDHVDNFVSTSGSAGSVYGILLPLGTSIGLTDNWGYQRKDAAEAMSGWVIGQKPEEENLFRFKCLHVGEEIQKNYLIAIEDLALPSNPSNYNYSTFTVAFKTRSGTTVERYVGCNLDPNSPNYIAKRIGDQYLDWDAPNKRYRTYGEFQNQSNLFYIEMNDSIDTQGLLPMGFRGPVRPKGFALLAGETSAKALDLSSDFAGAVVQSGDDSVVYKGHTAAGAVASAGDFVDLDTVEAVKFVFPKMRMRVNGTDGGASNQARSYWGVRPKISAASTQNDPDFCDYVRGLPQGLGGNSHIASGDFEYSFTFTMHDLVVANGNWSWAEGNYNSVTSKSISTLISDGARQFIMPVWGGFDGFDITEMEPMRNSLLESNANETDHYTRYTINKAIDSISDPEVVPANLLLAPGFYETGVTNKLINVAESRKDVLALIDLEGDYEPRFESLASSLGGVSSAVSSIKQRNLNSSYAAAFYPWVQISDNLNNSQLAWVPPSVAGLGALGRSEAQSDVWFAPAGFNRGGLGSLGGSRGPKVIQARQRLDSKERDLLYEVNINPIATFPAEGVVIFGQKTLQADASALDRINVRRLVLYLKSRVAAISRNLLFDQNVESTWNRFKSQVNPVLSDTKARFGLSDYKLILDETTTTADLVDRNIMYAKVYIKPARAIEYIVVDFVITRTGADFV